MYLFYDTETSGLPDFRKPSDAPNQPHIVQLAALLTDDAGNELGSVDLIVCPDGWDIPDKVAAIHGISQEKATDCGVPEKRAVEIFLALATIAGRRVAHNDQFDARIVRIALKRFYQPVVADHWKAMPSECTMKTASPIMQMEPTERMVAAGFNHHKNPKLSEAYEHFFGEELEGAHNAMVDVRACKRIFFEMKALTPEDGSEYG